MSKLTVTFIDSGREPKHPPNPKYPDGMDVDLSEGAAESCETAIPYPAPRCGLMKIECETCGMSVGVTVAGRPDDPRSARIPCKVAEEVYPRGKLGDDDEGTLSIHFGTRDDAVVIDFGKPVTWIGMPAPQAIWFAEQLLLHARKLRQ